MGCELRGARRERSGACSDRVAHRLLWAVGNLLFASRRANLSQGSLSLWERVGVRALRMRALRSVGLALGHSWERTEATVVLQVHWHGADLLVI